MCAKAIAFSSKNFIDLSSGALREIYHEIPQLAKSPNHRFIYHNDQVWAQVAKSKIAPRTGGELKTVYGYEAIRRGHRYYAMIHVAGGVPLVCPVGKAGDVIAVPEYWNYVDPDDRSMGVLYKIDDVCETPGRKWRSPYKMPKCAIRLFLKIEKISIDRMMVEDSMMWSWVIGVCRVPKPATKGSNQ